MANRKNKQQFSIFKDFSDLCDDRWVDFYRRCADGKFPPRVKLYDNFITFRKGTNTIRHQIPKIANRVEVEKCCNFFISDVGVVINSNEEESEVKVKPLAHRLRSLRRVRNLHILMYVDYKTNLHKYTKQEKDELLTLITLCWLSGLIKVDMVVIEEDDNGNERIVDIPVIEQNPENKHFYLVGVEVPATTSKTVVSKSINDKHANKSLYNKWIADLTRNKLSGSSAMGSILSDDENDDES